MEVVAKKKYKTKKPEPMLVSKRRHVWCPRCNNYRITPGERCSNCKPLRQAKHITKKNMEKSKDRIARVQENLQALEDFMNSINFDKPQNSNEQKES